MDRRVVAVKIDNHPQARPHSNLHLADAVYEVLVEGGLTRFIALFHQGDSAYVGPVRSGRPTDVALIKPLGGPFQISGAQQWVRKMFAAEGLHMVYDSGVTTFRARSRSAPHNLYASTEAIRQYADDRGWPDDPPAPLFGFTSDATEPTEPATKVSLPFSQHPASNWDWDGSAYLHSYGTTPHMSLDQEGKQQQIAADVIVVVEAGRYTAWDPAGKGKQLPSLRTVGTWPAHVFYDGGVVHVTWIKEDVDVPARLFDADGTEVLIPPGRLWIEVFPDNQTVSWE